jgi:hypothetical protein
VLAAEVVVGDENGERLHVMTIGDKDSQSEDIKQCEAFVNELLKNEHNALQEKEHNDQANQQAAG